MSPNSSDDSPRNVGVVIPAGGSGARAGVGPLKQLRPIAGVPTLLRSIRPFAEHPRVREIVVPLPAAVADDPPDWLGRPPGAPVRPVRGGATRADSVRQGVRVLDPAVSIVLIHDAARPLVAADIIDRVLAAVDRGQCALAAIPVGDTLKRCGPDSDVVRETVDRRDLWRAQTPQGFPRATLVRCYDGPPACFDGASWTDEASLVEACGETTVVVMGSPINLKVTTPEDFRIAEGLIG